ncbi:Rv1157c family protein [Nocardia rhizosphaerae]|uniref:Ig-like domain-containing protein n=1 Tax=Nocardia rhizosphaerae TaxID=1691571 RepID=A0ABV8KZA8_9NOCA
MLRTRGSRTALSALVIAVSFAAPATTMAAPQTATAPNVPAIAEDVPSETLAALAPSIVGAIAAPAPIADSAQAAILAQARVLLATPGIPAQVKSTLERVITFLDGSGGGGPELPPSDGPRIAQFLYPTIGKGCIGPTSDSVGTALAVPGPAELPPPGPAAGQTGFVFTALGTKTPTAEQNPPMTVQWVNLDNRRSGNQPLTTEAAINPDGPATLSAIADTGTGRVAAVITGGLTTETADGDVRTCTFAPTIGFFTVG